MAIIPMLLKDAQGPLKKGISLVGSYISHEYKITPKGSDIPGTIWRRSHQDEALGICICAPGSG